MEVQELERMIREKEGMLSLAFPALMRKVYVWMSFALLITGIMAYGVAESPALMQTIFSNKLVFWGIIIAQFALVFGISGAINRLSLPIATLLFVAYASLNGIIFSSIFVIYSTAVIAKVFFITAGTFGAMSLYGYFTKADLSGMGKILMMALIGLIIATVVNIFLKSSGLEMILSYVGVLIFVGLTAWDTQKIKMMLAQCQDMNEEAQKIALLGAFTLYLDFINLFIYLLRIFGRKE
ncbi:MAG: Bax inhibitor-1/YccA family protein [Prevotella sp.]|nr:Bax inhibitor-1/YccA family protein [Prevotella sp.]MDD7461108.1 Bax inhibitor-1/YccA family protein [Prevotellaceae bacterium]MDY3364966.1 Bax inhibitor-1/YccA family protein [Prevotella sp.]MDY3851783.1 Bax inhibitor-1/YccA family protein [Prevotella sp.]